MSMLLAKALFKGKVVVRNNSGGEVMVRVYRPDPERPGRSKHVPILVPPYGTKDLTSEATVQELQRSETLKAMCSMPYSVLTVVQQ